MKTNQRIFIAAPLPDDVQTRVGNWMESLQQKLSFQKWVHSADLHITLQFLGDTSPDKTLEIVESLRAVAAAASPFNVSLAGLGVFGKKDAPSILWIGIQDQLNSLPQLQKNIESAMNLLGFEKEARAYTPHLTLARKFKAEQRLGSGLTEAAQPA